MMSHIWGLCGLRRLLLGSEGRKAVLNWAHD
jgi:hypothetical protein